MRPAIVHSIGQLGGLRTVGIRTPDTDQVCAPMKCPGENQVLGSAGSEREERRSRIAHERSRSLPMNVTAYEASEVGCKQIAIAAPIKAADIFSLYDDRSCIGVSAICRQDEQAADGPLLNGRQCLAITGKGNCPIAVGVARDRPHLSVGKCKESDLKAQKIRPFLAVNHEQTIAAGRPL